MGKLLEARQQLTVCAQKSCNSVVRGDCEKWIKEVEEQTPTIIVRVLDARGNEVLGAKVTIDDEDIALDGTPVKVDPGKRRIRATARSGDVMEQKTLVAQGEKSRIVEIKFDKELAQDGTRASATTSDPATPPKKDEPETAPTSAPSNVVPITLAAIGGAAIISFAFFEITGQSDYSDLQSGCGNTPAGCSPDQKDPVRTKFIAAGISLGIGVAAVTAAAIVYFTRSKPAATAAQLLTRGVTF